LKKKKKINFIFILYDYFIKKMALQDLLSGYSQDINARIQHEQDHEQEVADRKANTVEEHFQHFKDAMESAGQEAGVAGMAIHMGRKVWQKYQAKYKNKPGQSGDAEEQPKTATENPDQNADADQRPVGEEEPPAEGETGGGEAPAGAESGEAGTGAGTEEESSTGQQVEDEATQRQAIDDATKGEFPEPAKEPTEDLGRSVAADQSETPATESAPNAGGEEPASITEAPASDVPAPTGDLNVADGLTGDSSSLTDTAGNVLKTAAKKVASSGIDDALGAAGDVLDFLGPLGEVAGLGLGLYSLIKGLTHKHPKEVVEQNQQQQMQGAGIDASALKQAAPVVGTLV
jgi:hypothetical protein